ncbi:Fis family transcriptional regulator [Paraburkholderia sp. DGU8]|uniref:Fis family transcriptional regulator n=1 Tax=Paraburkholderia sp. DGU8 TaxID=3161997 RepID=UPI003466AE7D
MDRSTANELVLPVRIAFERVRCGKPERDAVVCLAQTLLLLGFLTEAGFGLLDTGTLDGIEKRLLAELNRPGDGAERKFADDLVDELNLVVNEYDRLLHETRLQAIVEANESFARLKARAQ